jgi:hypothetical protein
MLVQEEIVPFVQQDEGYLLWGQIGEEEFDVFPASLPFLSPIPLF